MQFKNKWNVFSPEEVLSGSTDPGRGTVTHLFELDIQMGFKKKKKLEMQDRSFKEQPTSAPFDTGVWSLDLFLMRS